MGRAREELPRYEAEEAESEVPCAGCGGSLDEDSVMWEPDFHCEGEGAWFCEECAEKKLRAR